MAKNTNPKITSPKGIAKYPHLRTPDTKFNKDGVYTIKVRFPANDASVLAYIGRIDEEHKKAIAAAEPEWEEDKKKNKKLKGELSVNDPYFLDDDADEYEVSYKMNSSYTNKKGERVPLKPSLFDSKNKPLKGSVKVTGGSVVRVAAEMVPYYKAAIGAGLSMRLNAVQVVDLKVWGQDPEALGFEVEEDGYEGSGEDTEEDTNGFTDEDASGEDPDNGGDF